MAEQVEQSRVDYGGQADESQSSALSQFAEDVAGSLVAPVETLRDIGRREAIIPALALVVLIVGISVAGQLAVMLLNVMGIGGVDLGIAGPAAGTMIAFQISGILWNIVWGPVLWTIVAAVLYGVTYLLGGRGRFLALWAASGFALTPQLLVAPIASANELLGWVGTGWQLLGMLVVIPITIGAFCWTVGLYVIAIRETMNVTTGRAFGAIGLLLGGLILLGILLACVFLIFGIALVAALAG
jgi:hypothetical protein